MTPEEKIKMAFISDVLARQREIEESDPSIRTSHACFEAFHDVAMKVLKSE